MRILSMHDATAVLQGRSPDFFIESVRAGIPVNLGPYMIPGDSGTKTSIARDLGKILLPDLEILLFIKGWMVWPSAEHFDLFDGYRRSVGEKRSLQEAPIHVFSSGDESTFTSILAMGLYFVWDVQIFDIRGNVLLTFSHDEWMEFRLRGSGIVQRISEWAAAFKLEPLAPTQKLG